MATAAAAHKWLLVNVQEAGALRSLTLNRDVWAHDAVRALLDGHFALWQRSHQSTDASAYVAYYPASRLPHVAVVDPRTGERLAVWGERPDEVVDRGGLLPALTAFAADHVCEGGALGPAHWADKAPEVSTRRGGGGGRRRPTRRRRRPRKRPAPPPRPRRRRS
ncbi:hypothetical protein BU14_0131s0026 [Porphyra umbilicalis]|uniref:UAS domain-containing protein n=1 Tax=Porphyra umbilicalis TaxID=2786 RepID=A0A1X6PB09_PORUM|nr:hypothetical protein BU14_0131s0026 [Porphyra umbilicalis]|eukprot:OSX77843.1 hypothetical protein BU14_0131s0026 [Porphyra umbilicalis]